MLKEILDELAYDFLDKLKTVRGALTALFIAAWFGLILFSPKEVFHPSWNSREASESLTLALKEFCAELYPESTCPRINHFGKTNLIYTALFSAESAPSIDSVANVLQRKGWVLGAVIDVRTTTYCRAGYAASYITSEERVWVSFSSGHPICDRSAVYTARQ